MASIPADLLSRIPQQLYTLVTNHWQDWCQSCEGRGLDTRIGLDLSELGYSWACSDFVARNCIRYPDTLLALVVEGFEVARTSADFQVLVTEAVSSSSDEAMLMKALRELRQREMLRIAWRDLNRYADIDVVLQELTDLATAMVAITLGALEQQQAESMGMPRDSDGDEQALLVIAMGKMGGGELNFSSDIDLVFCFAEDGETPGPRKKSHAEFYSAVIRKLVKVLDEVTVDGFVYRVDTRLRPFGQSGPLAMSFSGLEQYYQSHGRDWERYAMIKARSIAGREKDRRYLHAMLTPFIYRRYLDFSMLESIREMKSMIDAQMKRKGVMNNIKLGRGGIREIEFIGQTLQLIRAGREPELRERSIIKVLALLAEKNYLIEREVQDLVAAYWFLRRLENRLQMLGDKQTHSLPDDTVCQERIVLAMGLQDWRSLTDELSAHQRAVDAVFHHLVAAGEGAVDSHAAFALFWSDNEGQHGPDTDLHAIDQYLKSLGYQYTDALIDQLIDLRTSPSMKRLSDDSSRLMMQLLDSLLHKIADYPEQEVLLERTGKILKALAGRKVYISLLAEYPAIQLQMLTLCSASEWFTERLTRYPILLDSLLGTAESFRRKYDIRQLLELELKRIESERVGDDLELLMERMRQFKRQTVFTVAMLDVFYQEPVESVSDHLTELADVLLEKILDYSWKAMVMKYGEPRCLIDGVEVKPTMAIIAYGKLGGNELGYGSDLDIIFVHNSQGEQQQTTGERCIENQQFFARVAQRVIHFLNTRTYSGVLYEADARLRPDGQAGLMVSSIVAFEQYQREKAWTWEHQALIRARFVTGNALIEQEFDRIRSSVLWRPRDKETLLQEVVDMREKMRVHLANKSDGFDIKQDTGGLVDIEFVVQAGVLLYARDCADCIRHTATLELINALLVVGWFSEHEAAALSQAYRVFRQMKNWQNLKCDIDKITSTEEIARYRENVKRVWQRLMPAVCE